MLLWVDWGAFHQHRYAYRQDQQGEYLVAVMRGAFPLAHLGYADPDASTFHDVWEYDSLARAMEAMRAWNPFYQPEPEGWVYHPASGRRRPLGNVAAEYVCRKEVPCCGLT